MFTEVPKYMYYYIMVLAPPPSLLTKILNEGLRYMRTHIDELYRSSK